MKLFKLVIFFLLLCLTVSAQTVKVLTQYSTIDALLNGVYDGEVLITDIKEHSNFGIGTFNELDGEMVLLDGVVYQVKSDGNVVVADDETGSPFFAATNFIPDTTIEINSELKLSEVEEIINSLLPSENIFYAIKITGQFRFVKTRSVPAQNRPYRKLIEIVKEQPMFEFDNCTGTVVGFKCPSFVKGINVPGYHFHFLNTDLNKGGHILELESENIKLEISYINNFELKLPSNDDFYKTNLSGDKSVELKKVEK